MSSTPFLLAGPPPLRRSDTTVHDVKFSDIEQENWRPFYGTCLEYFKMNESKELEYNVTDRSESFAKDYILYFILPITYNFGGTKYHSLWFKHSTSQWRALMYHGLDNYYHYDITIEVC